MSRPNILLITADQWRGEALGALGHMVRTPHIDALAAEGTLFARHYAPCAPCSPARASLYTGLYQMNHRVVWNGAPLDHRFDNVARAARRAGYVPTLFGYTDTSPDPRQHDPHDPELTTYEGVLPGFYQRQALPEDDKPWMSWLEARGHEVDPETIHHVAPEPGQKISLAPTSYGAEETQTAFLTGEFLRWMGEQAADRPWFAHISFLRPHPPFAVPAPFNAMYDPAKIAAPLAAETPDAEAAQHPFIAAFQPYHTLSSFVPGGEGLARDLTTEDFARIRAIYYGMISEVDAQIGRLVAGLRAAGQYDDTLIVFTSDHAELLGDHWALGKGGFFEQSYHIPLVLRVPGIGGAGQVEAFTSAADIFPTVCEAMGVAPNHAPDGRSLLPFTQGETPDRWRDAAIWEFDFSLALAPEALTQLGLAPEDCVLVCRRDAETLFMHSPALPPALYDLAADPACLTNIAATAAETRLQKAEALLAERARRADRTLCARPVWDWAAKV